MRHSADIGLRTGNRTEAFFRPLAQHPLSINDRCRARRSRFDPTQSCYAFAALRIPALLIPSCVPTRLAAQGPNRIMGAA